MSSLKESLYDTKLSTIKVYQRDLKSLYLKIGDGDESSVYNYADKYAIKIFCLFSKEALKRKFKKIEVISSLKDESFCFPLGLVSVGNRIKAGCYTKLIEFRRERKDFGCLETIEDKNKVLEYILKADSAMKRIHGKDVIIGDVKMNNILIDKNDNPIFIDTDNFVYQDFDFDLRPYRADLLMEK